MDDHVMQTSPPVNFLRRFNFLAEKARDLRIEPPDLSVMLDEFEEWHRILGQDPDSLPTQLVLTRTDLEGRLAEHLKRLRAAREALIQEIETFRSTLVDIEDRLTEAMNLKPRQIDEKAVFQILNDHIFETYLEDIPRSSLKRMWESGELPEPFTSDSDISAEDLEFLADEHAIFLDEDGGTWIELVPR